MSSDCRPSGPLHVAAASGNYSEVQKLLSQGIDASSLDEKFRSALYYACQAGSTTVVELLLSHNCSTKAHVKAGKVSPLHVAAQRGHVECMYYLQQAGADVNATTMQKEPVLHAAAQAGQAAAVLQLYSSGTLNTDATNPSGWTAMHIAADSGHEEVVAVLISIGAAPDLPSKYGLSTPLHLAAEKGHVGICRRLLQAGASRERPMSDQRTPLTIAQSKPDTDLLQTIRSTQPLHQPTLHPADCGWRPAAAAAAAAAAAGGGGGSHSSSSQQQQQAAAACSHAASTRYTLQQLQQEASSGAPKPSRQALEDPLLHSWFASLRSSARAAGEQALPPWQRGPCMFCPLADGAPPEVFLDPLSQQVFRDPVIAMDGLTYEKEELLRYWQQHPGQSPLMTDPATGKAVLIEMWVVNNHLVKYMVESWLGWRRQQQQQQQQQNGGHASIEQQQVSSRASAGGGLH